MKIPRSYGILFILLLGIYALNPIFKRLADPLTTVLFYSSFFYGAHIGATPRKLRVPFYVFMALSLLGDIAINHLFSAGRLFWAGDTVVKIVLGALLAIVILRDIRVAKRITLDMVLGACSVYFIIALTWALVYSLVVLFDPGAFAFSASLSDPATAGVTVQEGRRVFHELFYFSLVTMTTLGYGDICPQSETVRSLAALEAFVGQLFVAITIAYLVGLQIAHSGDEEPGDEEPGDEEP